jgi:hypothetical protein
MPRTKKIDAAGLKLSINLNNNVPLANALKDVAIQEERSLAGQVIYFIKKGIEESKK